MGGGFSFDAATLIIPPGRMKTNEAFSVPLSHRALDILRALEAERGRNPFVFAGRPQRPLSNMALAMLLRRMNVDVTAHGFRTSFRTWCSDVAHAEFEVAEQCLSHRVGSAVSRAYNRTSMLERRRPLMQAWADFVTGETGGATSCRSGLRPVSELQRAISIRQPWRAWAVVHAGKDVENRSETAIPRLPPPPSAATSISTPSKGMTRVEYERAAEFTASICVRCPAPDELQFLAA